jgi:hypothetical protein
MVRLYDKAPIETRPAPAGHDASSRGRPTDQNQGTMASRIPGSGQLRTTHSHPHSRIRAARGIPCR